MAYLKRIHTAVINNSRTEKPQNIMELCKKVVSELGLPPFAVNPLVARAFASSLAVIFFTAEAQSAQRAIIFYSLLAAERPRRSGMTNANIFSAED